MGGYAATGFQIAQLVAGQQQSRRAAQAQSDQVSAQNQLLAQQQAVKVKQQRDLMTRQLATTRARLASGGMGVGGGSSQALLAGMVKGNETDIADADFLQRSRQAAAGSGLSSGSGLQEGLALAQKTWGILRGMPGMGD